MLRSLVPVCGKLENKEPVRRLKQRRAPTIPRADWSARAIVSPRFYNRNGMLVAQELLGCFLVHHTPSGILCGKIVETESYLNDDPASHSFRGQTDRNVVMFGPSGHIYMYFIYDMHWCFNVVSGPKGSGEAVLIRALEPTYGVPQMQVNRKLDIITRLCNGPAKLVQALGIPPRYNGAKITQPQLYIEARLSSSKIVSARRIGLRQGKEALQRFYLADNKFISYK